MENKEYLEAKSIVMELRDKHKLNITDSEIEALLYEVYRWTNES